MNFEYKASVIIAVYNRGHMVHTALDSLLRQTLSFHEMQVIIVNDGSTDDSLSVCQKYSEKYKNVLVLDKPNGGQGSARNYGIQHATGKYIFFLDDDDELAEDTISSVTDWYDGHYDEVDLTTYKICYITDGKRNKNYHFRYRTLTESGVYDLNENPSVVQSTVNVCVRNKFEKNILFRETRNFYMEDQAYNNEVLAEKMKIGYCEKGEYLYNRHSDSVVSDSLYPLYCFENVMAYFEELFSKYEKVPPYYQCMYVHNLSFRFKDNRLFPYYLEGEDYENAINRISNLLKKVDETLLMSFEPLNEYHRVFFLSLKPNADIRVEFTPEYQRLYHGDNLLLERVKAAIVVRRFFFNGENIRMIGYIRSPFMMFTDKPVAYAQDMVTGQRFPLDLGESSYAYYCNTEQKCTKSWMFDFKLPLENVQQIQFFVEMGGYTYDLVFLEFDWNATAYANNPGFLYVKGNTRLNLKNSTFYIKKLTPAQLRFFNIKHNIKLLLTHFKAFATYRAVKILKKKSIWLYNDNMYTVKDNGYYQFQNDFGKNDGIKRYFVIDGDGSRMKGLFTKEQEKYLLKFASIKHKLLFLSCSKILSSFCESSSFTPIIPKHHRQFFDVIDFEVIYLQHGILHATTPTKYSKDRVKVDRIVISTNFELNNFITNYGYKKEDLILTGMARYDYCDLTKKPQNLILYAPSWRDKLIGKYVNRERKLYDSVVLKSNYYKGIVEFLTSPKLLAALEENDIYLDFKPHPNFRSYIHLFEHLFNERIRLAAPNVNLEDYSLFITDFSSFNFDYIYQGRQLLYFVPDYLEFKGGNVTFYRDVDLKFEDGFGDFAKTATDAVDLTIKRIQNGFATDPQYKERIENFFIEKGNHCERLYQFLMQNG